MASCLANNYEKVLADQAVVVKPKSILILLLSRYCEEAGEGIKGRGKEC